MSDRAAAGAAPLVAPLGIGEKLGFLGFSSASNIVYQFKSLYYLFFLTNVLKIDVLVAGSILTVGMVWDAVNDPLLGFWAVNHRFASGERCRPFAIWYALPWAVTVTLLFVDFGLAGPAQVVVALAVYLVFELFNTFVAIPYNSMASLATDRDSDRRSINIFRNLGGVLGSGIGAVACLPLLKLFGALDARGNLRDGSSSRGFLFTAALMGAICLAGCLVHYLTTRERVRPLAEKEERLTVRQMAGMLFRSRSWLLNTAYVLCYGVINTLTMTCIAYYATYVLGSTAAATAIQAAYLAAALLSSFLVAPIDRALGRKRTMILGAAVYIAGRAWFALQPGSLAAMYLNAATMGFAVSVTFVMFNTNRNNIVDLVEWREGRRLDSLVSTADNLVAKLGTAGAVQLIALVLAGAGLDPKLPAQPAAVSAAIAALLGWMPMAVAVCMIVALLFFDIERETQAMNAEKAAARSRAAGGAR